MNNIIQFINKSEFEQIHLPEPAAKNIPEWYRDAPSKVTNKEEESDQYSEYIDSFGNKKKVVSSGSIQSIDTDLTIKRCIPVFDAMSVGYILKVPGDIEVYTTKSPIDDKKATAFSWTPLAPIDSHSKEQLEGYPHNGVHKLRFPKFINPWIIKTAPGYSCLFIPPVHRELKFNILPGIVDTDTFDFAVNFPFIMTDPDFEGTIKGGTPMVQVIPFKRDSFSHEVYDAYDYVQKYPDTTLFQKEFPDSYKKNDWHKKGYK